MQFLLNWNLDEITLSLSAQFTQYMPTMYVLLTLYIYKYECKQRTANTNEYTSAFVFITVDKINMQASSKSRSVPFAIVNHSNELIRESRTVCLNQSIDLVSID